MAKGIKTGGRQLGTPNKRTAIGERVAEFVEVKWMHYLNM